MVLISAAASSKHAEYLLFLLSVVLFDNIIDRLMLKDPTRPSKRSCIFPGLLPVLSSCSSGQHASVLRNINSVNTSSSDLLLRGWE